MTTGGGVTGKTTRIPSVSIGLPVHNGARFLSRALESILGQDYADFEIVVSDNGSTDGSAEVARRYARRDPRVRVHTEALNRGAAWNFNHAFHQSRGEYFKWAAHDDMYRPGFLRRCVEALEADRGIVLVYPETIDIDESDEPICPRPSPRIAQADSLPDRLGSVLGTPSPCFEVFGLMRREDLAKTSLIGGYTSSDRVLLLELAALGRFHIIDEPLFLHRQHSQRSVTVNPRGRDRSAWFDTRLEGSITFPRWRLGREYARVLWSIPGDRKRLLGHFSRWVAANRTALLRESLGGGRDQVLRLLRDDRGRARR